MLVLVEMLYRHNCAISSSVLLNEVGLQNPKFGSLVASSHLNGERVIIDGQCYGMSQSTYQIDSIERVWIRYLEYDDAFQQRLYW